MNNAEANSPRFPAASTAAITSRTLGLSTTAKATTHVRRAATENPLGLPYPCAARPREPLPKVSSVENLMDILPRLPSDYGQTVLLFSQNQIDHPAAADMRPRAPAVIENLAVGAAGVFQRVAKNWHDVIATIVVNRLRELRNGAVVPGRPFGGDGRGAERIAEDVARKENKVLKRVTQPLLRKNRPQPVKNAKCSTRTAAANVASDVVRASTGVSRPSVTQILLIAIPIGKRLRRINCGG